MVLQISLCVVILSTVVLSAQPPSYKDVQWFEIEPAENTHQDKEELARTEFEPANKEWEKFIKTYGKLYKSRIEEEVRFLIFRDNLDYIIRHNKDYMNGNKTYFLGINQLTDLNTSDIIKLNGYRVAYTSNCSTFLTPSNIQIPDQVDWRTKGYVTKVKNQGHCGSCWSFSVTGSLEGQLYRKTKKLTSLSEQQLIDCSGSFGNMGCNGGFMDTTFAYINQAGGIMSETDYPYKGEEGQCQFVKSKSVGTDTGCKDIPRGSESSLQQAVATVGPVSVAINAGLRSFQLYKGGIYNEPLCSSLSLNHAVLVVGYGKQQAEFWTVKNSWGSVWGQNGYILMSRNKMNQCGIASSASYPLV